MPFTIITQDSFVSTGANYKVNLPSSADYFVTTNITQMALAPATAVVIRGEWYGNGLTAINDGIRWKKTNSTNALNIDTFATATASNGFTYVTRSPYVEAPVTGTAITAANPAVVSMTNTYQNGDRVRLYSTTGMLQIGGMDFTISSVSGSAFTLLGLDASGFAAAATNVVARRISNLDPVEPEFLYVTKVSLANPCVVTVSQAHNYVVGQKIAFQIPPSFGMQELNRLRVPAVITAVGTYTMTLNIDSSAFTAFAFPASTASPTAQLFATLAPAGQSTQYQPLALPVPTYTGYNFNYAPFHTGQFTPYMLLSGGAQSPAGASGDLIVWQAYKMENGPAVPVNLAP